MLAAVRGLNYKEREGRPQWVQEGFCNPRVSFSTPSTDDCERRMKTFWFFISCLAVVSGLGCSKAKSPEELAVEELTRMGAHIQVDSGKYVVDIRSNPHFTDVELNLLLKIPHIVDLTLENLPITDEGLNVLEPLAYVSRLVLNDSNISGKGLQNLSRMPMHRTLTTLSLQGANITDEDAKLLTEFRRVQILAINGTQVSDRSIGVLKELPLIHLYMRGSKISANGVAELKQAKPDLEFK